MHTRSTKLECIMVLSQLNQVHNVVCVNLPRPWGTKEERSEIVPNEGEFGKSHMCKLMHRYRDAGHWTYRANKLKLAQFFQMIDHVLICQLKQLPNRGEIVLGIFSG